MAEYKSGHPRDQAADKASEAYQMAQQLATACDDGDNEKKEGLPSTHPIRLG